MVISASLVDAVLVVVVVVVVVVVGVAVVVVVVVVAAVVDDVVLAVDVEPREGRLRTENAKVLAAHSDQQNDQRQKRRLAVAHGQKLANVARVRNMVWHLAACEVNPSEDSAGHACQGQQEIICEVSMLAVDVRQRGPTILQIREDCLVKVVSVGQADLGFPDPCDEDCCAIAFYHVK